MASRYCTICGVVDHHHLDLVEHKYNNHVCVVCKKVEESYIYDYLINWIKNNGSKEGDYITVSGIPEHNEEKGGIRYNTVDVTLHIFFAYDLNYAVIYLAPNTTTFEFYCRKGENPIVYDVSGKLDTEKFTGKGGSAFIDPAIKFENYKDYSGECGNKSFEQFANGLINSTVSAFKSFLGKNIQILEVEDFGFVNF